MSKEYRLEQVEKEIAENQWRAFCTGNKEAENRLRRLKTEKSQLETEIAIEQEK